MFKKSVGITAVLVFGLSLFCSAAFAAVEIKLSNQITYNIFRKMV